VRVVNQDFVQVLVDLLQPARGRSGPQAEHGCWVSQPVGYSSSSSSIRDLARMSCWTLGGTTS
jgi:hypothetical protein